MSTSSREPKPDLPFARHPVTGKPVCGAKTRSILAKYPYCCAPPMANGRCRKHGGKTPPKFARDGLAHGRAAQYGRVFGPAFEHFLRDPAILETIPELALYDQYLTRWADLAGDGVSREWVGRLKECVANLKEAMLGRDAARVAAAFSILEKHVTDGLSQEEAWDQMLDRAKERSEIAQKTQLVMNKMDGTITEGQVVALFSGMLRIMIDVAGKDAARVVEARFLGEIAARTRFATGGGERWPALPAGREGAASTP